MWYPPFFNIVFTCKVVWFTDPFLLWHWAPVWNRIQTKAGGHINLTKSSWRNLANNQVVFIESESPFFSFSTMLQIITLEIFQVLQCLADHPMHHQIVLIFSSSHSWMLPINSLSLAMFPKTLQSHKVKFSTHPVAETLCIGTEMHNEEGDHRKRQTFRYYLKVIKHHARCIT